jgi:spermidine/putrescine transport system permease protein
VSAAARPREAPPAASAPHPAPQRSLWRELTRNPWGRPRFLALTTWLYIAWALIPALLAIAFSFNSGRSRSVFQGLSLRWWTGDPFESLAHNEGFQHAIVQSLKLAALDVAIATPVGFLLALGLTRWRGWGSRPSNLLMLIPLVTPELTMAVSLLLVFTQLAIVPFTLVHLGTPAQVVGQVTFSISYVVVIMRSRLVSLGREYEEAGQDLGATPLQTLRLVLLPLLAPALLASAFLVFALSIDDFVVTQYMSSGQSTTTVPMYLYSNARGGTQTPALNALATVLVALTVLSGLAAFLVYRVLGRAGSRRTEQAIGELIATDS